MLLEIRFSLTKSVILEKMTVSLLAALDAVDYNVPRRSAVHSVHSYNASPLWKPS